MLAQHTATEEERQARPVVWMGWKGFKPKNINNHNEGLAWSLDSVAVGSYLCVSPDKDSEYFSKFEIVRVVALPEDLSSDESLLDVEFHEFDR